MVRWKIVWGDNMIGRVFLKVGFRMVLFCVVLMVFVWEMWYLLLVILMLLLELVWFFFLFDFVGFLGRGWLVMLLGIVIMLILWILCDLRFFWMCWVWFFYLFIGVLE